MKTETPNACSAGASWAESSPGFLLSSSRNHCGAYERRNDYGFRCVQAAEPTPAPTAATKETPFVNTLGMKFVPVPILGGPTGGQKVLFSMWDTRVQDSEVFVKETKREWAKPRFEQGPTHPGPQPERRDAGH